MIAMDDIAVIKLGEWHSIVADGENSTQPQYTPLIATLPENENSLINGPIKIQGYGFRLVPTAPWYGLGVLDYHRPFLRSFSDGTGPSKFKPCLK